MNAMTSAVPAPGAPTVLLGPQRFKENVGPALDALGLSGPDAGPIVTINAGWEEREDDVGELDAALGGRSRNLRLHHRLFDVIEKAPEVAAAALTFRDRHDELLDFYRIRLEHALAAVTAVQRRTSRLGIGPDAEAAAIDSLRQIDEWYLAELTSLYATFDESAHRDHSELIGWHCGEIAAMLDDAAAVVMTGGHVGVLLRALRIFEVTLPFDRPVIAWSAGAMALTDTVLLFHDFAPQGSGVPEVHAPGLGRLPGLIALPHARRRLDLADQARSRVLAQRFSGRDLLLLDDGTSLRIEPDQIVDGRTRLPNGARVLGPDGLVHEVDANEFDEQSEHDENGEVTDGGPTG